MGDMGGVDYDFGWYIIDIDVGVVDGVVFDQCDMCVLFDGFQCCCYCGFVVVDDGDM